MELKTDQILLRLEPSRKKLLVQEAKKRGLSLAALFNVAVSEFINK
jgi:hypothetical protein